MIERSDLSDAEILVLPPSPGASPAPPYRPGGEVVAVLAALGESCSLQQARNHLREDGRDVTEEEFARARQALGWADPGARKRRERGPARGQSFPTKPVEDLPVISAMNNGAPGRPEKFRRVCAVLKELGPLARRKDLNERLAGEGIDVGQSLFTKARKTLGFPDGRGNGSPRKAPRGGRRPAQRLCPSETPKMAPPSPADPGKVLEGFLAAVRAVGGRLQARRLLDLLETEHV